MKTKTITVLVDNDSWILPYAHRLVEQLNTKGYEAYFAGSADAVQPGWANFMLGCTRIVSAEVLKRSVHNLVVHESHLPRGRGFAPIAWQILEGKNVIPICVIEATEEVDAGDIWLRDEIVLDGTELCREWRHLQGEKTLELCFRFVAEYDKLRPIRQQGEPSWYPRRRPTDSQLDANKTIQEQFNLLRVVDNECYPAFVIIKGVTYMLKIEKTFSRRV